MSWAGVSPRLIIYYDCFLISIDDIYTSSGHCHIGEFTCHKNNNLLIHNTCNICQVIYIYINSTKHGMRYDPEKIVPMVVNNTCKPDLSQTISNVL